MNLFSRIVDLLLLNFLFVITSLPVLTLGASLTALFSVSLKLVRNEESYVSRDYFRAFKKNFCQATVSFWAFSLIIALLAGNLMISFQQAGNFYLVLLYDLFSVYDFYWNLFFVLFSGSGTFLFHYTPDPASYTSYDLYTFFRFCSAGCLADTANLLQRIFSFYSNLHCRIRMHLWVFRMCICHVHSIPQNFEPYEISA